MKKTFFTNPAMGVNVCKMDNYPDVGDRLKTPEARIIANHIVRTVTVDKRPVFTGKSTCHESDTYDEKTGRNIASSRADLQYHRAMVADYKTLKAFLETAIQDVDNLLDHHTEIIDKTKGHINRLSDKN